MRTVQHTLCGGSALFYFILLDFFFLGKEPRWCPLVSFRPVSSLKEGHVILRWFLQLEIANDRADGLINLQPLL